MSTTQDGTASAEPGSAALSVPSSAAKGRASNTAAQVKKKSEKLDLGKHVGRKEGAKKGDNLDLKNRSEPQCHKDRLHLQGFNDDLYSTTLIDFKLQHDMLEAIQRRLEQAAFAYYKRNSPLILEKQGWSCKEEAEWNEWLKYLLKPGNERVLPGDPGDIATIKDLLDRAFSIRNSAVHRVHVSSREMTNLLTIAQNLLIAFNDTRGARMAHEYIALVSDATTATIQNHQEFDMRRATAERESKDALIKTEALIKAHLKDKLQPQIQKMSSIIATIEADATSEPVMCSSAQETTSTKMKVYRAVSVVRQGSKWHFTLGILSIGVASGIIMKTYANKR